MDNNNNKKFKSTKIKNLKMKNTSNLLDISEPTTKLIKFNWRFLNDAFFLVCSVLRRVLDGFSTGLRMTNELIPALDWPRTCVVILGPNEWIVTSSLLIQFLHVIKWCEISNSHSLWCWLNIKNANRWFKIKS